MFVERKFQSLQFRTEPLQRLRFAFFHCIALGQLRVQPVHAYHHVQPKSPSTSPLSVRKLPLSQGISRDCLETSLRQTLAATERVDKTGEYRKGTSMAI